MKESDIIADAGKLKSIIITTSISGRGRYKIRWKIKY